MLNVAPSSPCSLLGIGKLYRLLKVFANIFFDSLDITSLCTSGYSFTLTFANLQSSLILFLTLSDATFISIISSDTTHSVSLWHCISIVTLYLVHTIVNLITIIDNIKINTHHHLVSLKAPLLLYWILL